MRELLLISVPGIEIDAHDGALLRVLLVPRLSGRGPTLESYGMVHWPMLLTDEVRMQVQLRTVSGQDLAPIDVDVHHVAQPEVWDAFFDQIRVVPFTSSTYPTTHVTPTGDHAEQVVSAYASATEKVGDPHVIAQQLDGLAFEEPPPAPDPNAPVPDVGDPDYHDPDFHRVIALMRHHPRVLRALGLVVDVRIPRDRLAACGPEGQVSVAWREPPVHFDVVSSPRTAFVVRNGERFFAAPAEDTERGLVVDGMVDLGRTTRGVLDWVVHALDIDAAVAQLGDAKAEVQRARERATPNASIGVDSTAMPALRSLGLQLIHRDRAAHLERRRARSTMNHGGADLPALTADDLVLGYRLDVRYGGADWYSMMWRSAEYTVNGLPIGGGEDREEAHVPPAAGVKGTGDDIYADGVVVRWDGHPLSVPTVRPDGRRPRGEVVHQLPYQFVADHKPDPVHQPERPTLRFGSGYNLRLRVVDLAGGGLDAGDVDGEFGQSPLTTFGRHEPVLPPEMPPPTGLMTVVEERGRRRAHVDPEFLGPGGALDRLVIRSDPAGSGEIDVATYPGNHTRMLLPPPAGFTVTEWHDRLNQVDEETARIARRALATPRASAESKGGRFYTWVPDAAAQSVSVTVLPLATRLHPSAPALRNWEHATWPDHPPKELRVVPAERGAGPAPSVDWDTHHSPETAVVSLPAACRAVVEVSSAIDPNEYSRFAAAAWAPTGSTAQQAIITGRHPVVTPARRLEVVHAVRKPLATPRGNLEASRQPGDTAAVIADATEPRLGIDRDSTAQLDVAASWNEWADAGPETPLGMPIVQSLRSLPVDLDAETLPPLVHEFGDTRHRVVTYRFAARSRFREFFSEADPESAFVADAEPQEIHVPSTVRPTAPVVLAVTPAFRTDTTLVSPPMINTTMGGRTDPDDVDADGIPDVFDEDIGEPLVIYTPPSEPTLVETREGGILRVELAGPWFTTGEGEQLGVVVSPGPNPDEVEREPGASGEIAAADNAHAAMVSTTYRDPLVQTAAPIQPSVATMTRTGGDPLVVLDIETGVPICVVPFDVIRIDGRWFADIGFGRLPDLSFLPFVRLQLVRFQRHSLNDLTTSPRVTADLVGILPRRELRVEWVNFQQVVTLLGAGAGGTVELRLEAAPRGTSRSALTTLDPAGRGWVIVDRHDDGALNVPFAPFTVPNDGRDHRIVVREYDPVAPRSDPGPTDPLDREHSRLTLFAAVVAVS